MSTWPTYTVALHSRHSDAQASWLGPKEIGISNWPADQHTVIGSGCLPNRQSRAALSTTQQELGSYDPSPTRTSGSHCSRHRTKFAKLPVALYASKSTQSVTACSTASENVGKALADRKGRPGAMPGGNSGIGTEQSSWATQTPEPSPLPFSSCHQTSHVNKRVQSHGYNRIGNQSRRL